MILAKVIQTAKAKENQLELEAKTNEASTETGVSSGGNDHPARGRIIQRPNLQQQFLNHHTPIQTKLSIGTPGDKYEQEADLMAERVISMEVPTIQPRPNYTQTNPLDNPIQRRLISSWKRPDQEFRLAKPLVQLSKEDGGATATPNIESRLANQKGGGTPLNEETRSFMETRFGNDFSAVRVHTDSSSVQMNQELGTTSIYTWS